MLKRARNGNANANAASKRLRAASRKRPRNGNATANAAPPRAWHKLYFATRPRANWASRQWTARDSVLARKDRARRPPANAASRQRTARDSAIARRRLQREYAQTLVNQLAMTRRALGRARSLRDQLDLVRRMRQLEMELHVMGARR